MTELPESALATLLKTSTSALSTKELQLYEHEAIRQGVALLIHQRLAEAGRTIQSPWRSYRAEQSITTSLQLKAINALFSTLKSNAITFTTLKGWALAVTHYYEAGLRPKTDIDILINKDDKEVVLACFGKLGFVNPRGWQPDFIIDQITMRKRLSGNVWLNVDIHFELTNDKRIQTLFPVANIINDSTFNKELGGPVVRTTMAFYHAVIHLLHHHANGDLTKLIWFYDIYLLLESMSEKETEKLADDIARLGLAHVFHYALVKVTQYFPNKNCTQLLGRLEHEPGSKRFCYLTEPPSMLKAMTRQLSHAATAREKIGVIKEGLFPPATELVNKYGQSNWPLWILYIRRIISGIFSRLF